MLAVVGIVLVVLLWRFLVLTAALVFEKAGLPPPAATFQARSALTGSGYTTGESEIVVNDPPSREAASMLFIIGFVGPVTILGLLGFGFFLPSSTDFEIRATVLVVLLFLFLVLERTGINVRLLTLPGRSVARVMFRAPSATTWTVIGDHAILGIHVSPSNPKAGQPLREQLFADSSITVLGIRRVEERTVRYLAHPSPDEGIVPGDELILYGPMARLALVRDQAE